MQVHFDFQNLRTIIINPPRYKSCKCTELLLQSRYLHKPRLPSLLAATKVICLLWKFCFYYLLYLPSTSLSLKTYLVFCQLERFILKTLAMKIELVAIFTIISLPLGKHHYMYLIKIYYLFTNGVRNFVAMVSMSWKKFLKKFLRQY